MNEAKMVDRGKIIQKVNILDDRLDVMEKGLACLEQRLEPYIPEPEGLDGEFGPNDPEGIETGHSDLWYRLDRIQGRIASFSHTVELLADSVE